MDWSDIEEASRETIRGIRQNQGFFTDEDIETVWPLKTLERVIEKKFLDDSSQLTIESLQKRLRILSILVEIAWPKAQWRSFGFYFRSQERQDKNLPFNRDTLLQFLAKE